MEKGFSVVEILIAMAIFLIVATAVVPAIAQTFTISRLGDNETDATFYTQEAIEAARSIKNQSWANLVDGTYGLATASGVWAFSGSNNIKGIYTRTVTVSDAFVDTSGNVQTSGCANQMDNNTKHVVATTNWNSSPTRANNVTLETYFTNWKKTAFGNWALPTQESSFNLSGTNAGTSIQVQGSYAYEARNSGSPNFAIFNISTSTPTLTASLTLTGSPTDIFVLGRYAYVSSSSSVGMAIIDVCTPSSPTVVGTFSTSHNKAQNALFVLGNYAYLASNHGGSDNDFNIVNISTPSSPSLTGSIDMNGDNLDVVTLGNYAYVTNSHNPSEIEIVNVTTPSSPTLVTTLNLSGNSDANSITGFGSTIMVGRANGDFDTVNVTTPSSPALLGTLNVGGNVNDISLGNGNQYAFLATSASGKQFQVINISTISSPAVLGTYNYGSTLNGVSYSYVNDRAYAATTNGAQELASFKPS